MSEFRRPPETPETKFSIAESQIAECEQAIERANAKLDLLQINAEALEALIEEAIRFGEMAEKMSAIDMAHEEHEQAMFNVEALVELRKKMATIRENRAKVEEALARFEAADAKLSAMASERPDKSVPAN